MINFAGIKRIYTLHYTLMPARTMRRTIDILYLSVLGFSPYHFMRRCTAIHVHRTYTHGHVCIGLYMPRQHGHARTSHVHFLWPESIVSKTSNLSPNCTRGRLVPAEPGIVLTYWLGLEEGSRFRHGRLLLRGSYLRCASTGRGKP